MTTATESRVVNAAGLAQGIVLVTFPAASTIFTASDEYDLSSNQYGALFLPQVVTAIAASLLAGGVARRVGTKRVFQIGLAANLIAMSLLLSTVPIRTDAVAYPLLLVATASLGIGFGLTVPTLNVLAGAFHPDSVDRAVLVLNALLGLGTVLAPVFVAIFVGLGFWWGLPIVSIVLLVALLVASAPLRLDASTGEASDRGATGIPARFWIFAAFAVLYGICETMNGNWSQLEMTDEVGASTTTASIALTAFWAAVTGGRVLFAAVERRLSTSVVYRVLPLVLAGAFLWISALSSGDDAAGVAAFALAGIGCSALLPLTISFAEGELVTISAVAAGWVIAAYQLGYGLAAFGAGPLQDAGLELSSIFRLTSGAAIGLAVLAAVITRRGSSPAVVPTGR